MIQFKAEIKKFDKQGEKTGWSYIDVSAEQAANLKPGMRKSFRVKGKLDDLAVEKLALIPMGNGDFIVPLNAMIRRGIRKQKGAEVKVSFEADDEPVKINDDLMDCLVDEPAALNNFQKLPQGHRNYFSKWVEAAKTEPTKAKRIAMAVNALVKGWGFSEMLRAHKKDKQQFSE